MTTKQKYAVILGNLGNTCDRFLSSGYKEVPERDELLDQAASIEGVTGIELVATWDITRETASHMKKMLASRNLRCASIIPDLFSRKCWGKGSICSADAAVRTKALEEIMSSVDMAHELECDLLNVWPGQDGYDYCLAADYLEERAWLADSIQKAARYAESKGVRLALEYKMKEPRTHSYLARAADTLLVALESGMDNVGVTIDTGHAFLAYENVAESIAVLSRAGNKLFHMHFNDNYSSWDDDMIVGSVRLVEYFEMLYWLETTGYAGWYSMDQYPYREDGCGAVRSSVLFLQRMQTILDRVGTSVVEALIRRRDPVATAAFIREYLIAGAA